MAVQKMEAFEFYRMLQQQMFNVEFICGKWFLNGREYELYSKNGLLNYLGKFFPWIEIERNSNAFVKYIMEKQSEPNGEWPEMPIVTEAKRKIAEGYDNECPLAYPLNEKELMIIHYLLDGDPKDTYAIFFHGVGKSGKSTICNLIASIFGDLDVSKCGFTQLGEKFSRETLAGKRLWYDSDISANWTESATNTLKKVITHDKDQFEQKGKNPYVAQYRCKALFCCNVAPRFDVSDSGLLRRIIYYSKNKKIENPDGTLANKVYTYEDLLNIVIAALKTDISNFYKTFEKETKEIIMGSNNVAKYGMCSEYDTYRIQCGSAGVYPCSKDKWEKLKDLFQEWNEQGDSNENKVSEEFKF